MKFMRKFTSQICFLAVLNIIICLLLFSQSVFAFKPALALTVACENPYMPFSTGDVIEYKTTGLHDNSSYTMKVTDVQPGSAKIEYEMNVGHKMTVSQNIFCKNGDITTDTYMDFSSGTNNLLVTAKTKEVSGQLMPKDLQIGTVWQNKYVMNYSYQGSNLQPGLTGYEMTITTNNKVLAEEKVTVPAGTFTALKVEATSTMDMSMPQIPESARSGLNQSDLSKLLNQKSITSTSVTMYEWWVKNIGLVKVTSSASGTNWENVAVKIGVSNSWLDNPTVEAVAEKAVAPAAVTAAVVNTALATQSVVSVDFLHYLIFFITQPIFFFRRKKQTAWGIVYNSLSRLPEDLVIVKLFEAKTNKLVTTQVTDDNGRFAFLVSAGQYKIEVSKKNFIFPSALLKNAKSDVQYSDLYYGQSLEINKPDSELIPNIPIDPQVEDLADAKIRKKSDWQKKQNLIALISPALGFVSFIIKPSFFVTLLLILSILAYFFFRRFALKKAPKKWGKVSEDKTATIVPGAVMRIFALPFNKLFDYKVTDKQGRYNFLVGNRQFLMTVTKEGYPMLKTAPLDFSKAKDANIIAEDITLKK